MLNSRLLLLCNINYEIVDKSLILAFVKKWQRDTSSFHLLVVDMTITLNDVSA